VRKVSSARGLNPAEPSSLQWRFELRRVTESALHAEGGRGETAFECEVPMTTLPKGSEQRGWSFAEAEWCEWLGKSGMSHISLMDAYAKRVTSRLGGPRGGTCFFGRCVRRLQGGVFEGACC
jgi:hypothetical protein